jgi:hypothetical protein
MKRTVEIHDLQTAPDMRSYYQKLSIQERLHELEDLRHSSLALKTVGDPGQKTKRVWGWQNWLEDLLAALLLSDNHEWQNQVTYVPFKVETR